MQPVQFKPISALEKLPPMQWLVQRYVPEDVLMLIYGKPNSFKSFVALDWAMSISAGREWLGAKVPSKRRACYIMGEGLRGLKQRVDAWIEVRGRAGDFFYLGRPVSILDPTSVSALVREMKRLQPAFLVVDTVARCFGSGDENSTQDMNAFVRACDQLRGTVPGMTLALVHHTGWNEDSVHRPRGSIALHAATDLEYLCIRPKGSALMTLKQPRAKDGEEMKDEHFRLAKVGESMVIERMSAKDPRTRKKQATNLEADEARAKRVVRLHSVVPAKGY
jgi:hypothetical protein